MKNSDHGTWRVLKKKAAAAALPKNKLWTLRTPTVRCLGVLISFYSLLWSPGTLATPMTADETLRQQLFKDKISKPACTQVKISTRGQTGLAVNLDAFISDLMRAIRTKDAMVMQPLFHPRLNTSLFAVKEILAKIDATLGGPLDVSVYRLWALNTVDGSPKGLPCEGDEATVYPHYGYSLQFGIWLQIMGQKEIGRAFATIVPVGDKWYLGSFYAQQWTHASKDPVAWAQQAQKDLEKGIKESAYLEFDLAAKLLEMGKNIEQDLSHQVITARDQIMTKPDFLRSMAKTLSGESVVYAASMLVTDGVGIMVRLRVPSEVALTDMQQRCRKLADQLAKESWTQGLSGLRCAFILPSEKPEFDGALGSLYLPFKN